MMLLTIKNLAAQLQKQQETKSTSYALLLLLTLPNAKLTI